MSNRSCGAVALLMTWGAMQLVTHYLHFRTVFFDARMGFIGVVVGMVIGFVGSSLSVGRHLRAGA